MYMHYTNSLTEAKRLLDDYGYDLVLIEANSRPGIKDIPELPGRTYLIFSHDLEPINILATEFGGGIISLRGEQGYGTYFAQGTELPDVILCTATLFPELDRLEAVNEVLGLCWKNLKSPLAPGSGGNILK